MQMKRLTLFAALFGIVCAKTFRYGVLGDFGTGGWEAGATFEVTSAVGYHDTTQEYDTQLTISTGDNFYCDVNYGTKHSFEELWVKPGTHGGGLWFPTRGNHDNIGPQYDYTKKNDKWWYPSKFYTREIDTGLNFTLQVWSIDTHDFGGDQLGWLENSLKKSKARWKVFITHYPWISAGRHKRVPSPVTVAALAKKYGVQAVYSGHDHLLQSMVHEGVAFVGSGATARGAMLQRSIDKDKSDFLWAWGTTFSVGYHGILHVSLSKNVMWGHLHSRGNLVHEFITVWDWPFRFNDLGEGDKKSTSFPSPKVVVKYLVEEADSAEQNKPSVNGSAAATTTTQQQPPAPAPTNNIDTSKVATINETEKVSEMIRLPEAKLSGEIPEKIAVYVIAAACEGCLGASVNRPFSLWVQGVSFTQNHRVFLAYSSADCTSGGEERAVAGGHVAIPTSPVVTFTVRGTVKEPTDLYVCLSPDKGKTYYVLKQADNGINSFQIYPEPPPPVPQSPQQQKPKQKASLQQKLNTIMADRPFSETRSVPIVYFYILVSLLAIAIPFSWYRGKAAARERRTNGKA